jgi:hypothetical protein
VTRLIFLGCRHVLQAIAGKDASLSYLLGCIGHGKAIAVDVVAQQADAPWFVLTGAG